MIEVNEEHELKYFNFYINLPIICAIFIFISCFILGIIQAGMMTDAMDYFVCWFVWVLVGFALSLINYFILKIILSYRILHILYLQKLVEYKKEIEAVKWNKQEMANIIDKN